MLKETLKLIAKSQKENVKKYEIGIPREKLTDIKLNTKHALVISGIRRCGKSTLLRQISKNLTNHHYLNFEDPRLIEFQISDFEKLNEIFTEEFGKIQYYFFDEIQNVEKWEYAIRHLLDQNKKVIITGSNASLLSKELGTKLTGRHIRHELFPFSYKEFIKFTNKKISSETFKEFLTTGGFPEYIEEKNVDILHELLNDVISRDIAVRYGIRNTKTLKELAIYLLTNVGKEFSYNKLKETFKMGSPNTAIDFISYFEDSYLLFTINKFDYSIRKQQVNPKKIYSIDNGLSTTNSVTFTDDKGRMLENAVFQHLRRKFKEIFYFGEKNECDFIIKDHNKITQALQVCYKLTEDNKEREIKGIQEAMEKFKLKNGKIITYNQEDSIHEKGKKIEVIPAWKWMTTNQ